MRVPFPAAAAGPPRRRRAAHVLGATLGLLLAALFPGVASAGGAAALSSPAAAASAGIPAGGSESDAFSCPGVVAAGRARCDARVRTDAWAVGARPAAKGQERAGVIGNNGAYDPAYLQSAYNLPSASGGAGQTVAVADAFDDPNAASDLAQYRANFLLPPCTAASGCFRKVDQRGGGSYPAADHGWSQEISLDLDMVSAGCPRCNILLVEADSNGLTDLGTAVNEAVALGAREVSNSYGGGEYAGETGDELAFYDHPGVAITASSGDTGYGVQFPAASRYVTAVGGTHLVQATNTGTRSATETAWSGAGSGCSSFVAKPAWQNDPGCAKRTVADVAAVADPATGVWVYDSFGDPGFEIFGGTSVAAPLVAAIYALASPAASSATPSSYAYAHPSSLNDITAGSNGSCGGSYLCTSGPGYDGPTGLGSANGLAAFSAGSTATPPTAALTVTPATGTAPLAVTADASGSTAGTNPIASYRFDFGDGTVVGPQAGATAGHSYAAGSYTVTLTVTDSGGLSASKTAAVSVAPASGGAGPAFVQGRAGAGVNQLAFARNVAQGDLLVVGITTNDGGTDPVSGVTDSLNGAWTRLSSVRYGNGHVEMYYLANTRAGAVTVTLVGGSGALTIGEYSGISSVNPLDQSATRASTVSGGKLTAGPTASLAQAGELVIGVGGLTFPGTFAAGSGYTLRESAIANYNVASGLEDEIASSTAGQSMSLTVTGSGYYGAIVAVFH